MSNNNYIFITTKQLMFLERLTYAGAIKKMKTIHEMYFKFKLGPNEDGILQYNSRISCTEYATYYDIEVDHVHEAIAFERLLILKPSDMFALERVNNIKTACYRYERSLVKLDKWRYKYRLSINEYAMLNNVSIEFLMHLIESEGNLSGSSTDEEEILALIADQETELYNQQMREILND